MKQYCLSFLLFAIIATGFSQKSGALVDLPFESIKDTIDTYRFSDFSQAMVAVEAYILKAQKEDDPENEWIGLEAKASTHYLRRNFKEANQVAYEMIDFAKAYDLVTLEIRSYLFAGDMQLIATTMKTRLGLYNQALDLAEEHGDERMRERALNKIADVMEMGESYEDSRAIRKKTLEIYENKPLDTAYTEAVKNGTLIYGYTRLVTSFLQEDALDSVKKYAAKINELSLKEVDSCYQSYRLLVQAEIDLKENNFVSSRKNFEKAYSICAVDYDLLYLNKAYSLGSVDIAAKNYPNAIRILQQALDNYQVKPEEEGFMDDYYEKLAEAYKQTGDFERASYYFEKYLTTQERFVEMKADAKEAFLEEERARFKSDFEALKIEKEKSQNYITYLLLGASVIILVLLFFLLKFYRTKKQNEAKFEALLQKIKKAEQSKDIIDTRDAVLEEKNSSDVPEETKQHILDGLKKLEAKEYFLQQDCNSYNVAKKINTNTSYLSKVINAHYGKNFNTYINDLRINYAIVRLKNDVIFRSYSIQSIAEELGYKSADSFTKYFKKDTGLNPSFYIKEIKNIA